jgi:hypothetical protein
VNQQWEAKLLGGAWRIGMAGNLDTVHDAQITVHRQTDSFEVSENIAHTIVRLLNMAEAMDKED